jgi:hypothetical protein
MKWHALCFVDMPLGTKGDFKSGLVIVYLDAVGLSPSNYRYDRR